MKSFSIALLLLTFLTTFSKSTPSRNLQEETDDQQDDENMETANYTLTIFDYIDFGRHITNGTNINSKPTAWEGMEYQDDGDSIKGYIPTSTKEHSKVVLQEFNSSKEQTAFFVIQYEPKNFDKNAIIVVQLNGNIIKRQIPDSASPKRTAVQVSVVEGGNIIKVWAEPVDEQQQSDGILIEEIGIYAPKQYFDPEASYTQTELDEESIDADSMDAHMEQEEDSSFNEEQSLNEDEDSEQDDEDQSEGTNKQIYAVNSGAFTISWSSVNGGAFFDHPWLDYSQADYQCWSPSNMNTKQWISIGSPFIMKWKKIIIQGRGDEDQWVSGYKVSYTTDGKTFSFVEKGRVFEGNFDRHTKVQAKFKKAIKARTIRIHPVEWHGAIALRFEAVCEENNEFTMI